MTELDTMKRAQMYVQKMAEGINPLTDEAVEDSDMINNVRISRCLYYVSDILKQVIANNGVVGSKPSSNIPFFITDEQRAQLVPFERPVLAKEIVDRINEVTAENGCKKFNNRWISEYFVSIGMLELYGSSKVPTEAGVEFGIVSENRTNPRRGDYTVNMYSPDVHQFIFDNIDAIVDFAGSEQYKQQTNRIR